MKRLTNSIQNLKEEGLSQAQAAHYRAGAASAGEEQQAIEAAEAPCPCVECTCGKRSN